MSGEFHHRSAFGDQSNKPFKGSSKRKAIRLSHGKVEGGAAAGAAAVRNVKNLGKGDGDGRQLRRLQASQRKEKHRSELVDQRRHAAGTSFGPPKLVGLVALGPHVALRAARTLLLRACGAENTEAVEGPITVSIPIGKRQMRVTFFEATRDQVDVLDVAKVADSLLLFMTPNLERSGALS